MPSWAASGLKRGGRLAHHAFQTDAAFRLHMLVHLDAGQRQKIVDQPAHARRFHAHDVEELVARHLIVLGMAASGSR